MFGAVKDERGDDLSFKAEGGKRVSPFPSKTYLFLLKNVLAQSAGGADPAVGNLLPGGARGDAVVRVAGGGVINVATGADILVYCAYPPKFT